MRTPDNATDFNNDCIEFCDVCNSKQMGTEMYCNDAMGIATPVLWVCHRCENPPLVVGLWRHLVHKVTNRYNRIKYVLTTTSEYRAKQAAHRASVQARINARRAERGEAPLPTKVKYVTFLSIYRKWRNAS